MLDLFSIFSKGGIVLWCFQSTSEIFTPSVNALIRSVILQERSGNNTFGHAALTLQYKLDNEFELVFVVAYQRILQLAYVDKLLSDVQREFRDKYKNELAAGDSAGGAANLDFTATFHRLLKECEHWAKTQAKIPKQMRSFEDSLKSKKTVASMIERKGEDKGKKSVKIVETAAACNGRAAEAGAGAGGAADDDDVIAASRARLASKLAARGKKEPKAAKSPKSPAAAERKQPRVWALGGAPRDAAGLDYGAPGDDAEAGAARGDLQLVGQMAGDIRELEVEDEAEAEAGAAAGGVFSYFKGLVGSRGLTQADMAPALERLRDHLISKNVAADIANKLCDSVAASLDGKVLGTFESVWSSVRAALTAALLQILRPRRRLDVLRDALHARQQRRPYVITFCGVNGVGKSTNLAKICFWLVENGLSVLVAACDTFRAGAVEQLRTHVRRLNALHPPAGPAGAARVALYEKGYGKDAASIAAEAIRAAAAAGTDVVLVDTAGRMQDNEPLMRALAKLITVNQPDLVLFVGEALVGNEAVDQLVRFNQALADHGGANPRCIDGIVLTKFDTIDDKVGAAISMTYLTGQPIVFVGTGQTYRDLKALNARAVVNALMK
ncbi:signal recognition particle receptor subunit alpha [Pectinophora gossypiella]|uniref:signal recognition particle receptor subunit alpha n=1 Tax=Pectinophora gossypiella TaxID=13191 RepID=UPI00214EA1E9|nr:signal recognition particle receptor subunit alpha [Pectinophora gossypiella]